MAQESVEEMINLAASRMYSAYTSYYIWKWLELSRNINNSGEDDAKNIVKQMNLQKGFFTSVIRGTFYCFVIDLCTFFDRQKPALSIDKIIKSLNLENEDLKEIEGIRKSQEENISHLKDIRDKTVAHLDLSVEDESLKKINFTEIEELFLAVQKIFNILTKTHDHSSWVWDLVKDDVEREMGWLFEILQKGEEKRLNDIKEKYP